jgi:predicted phage tail protein
MAIWLFYNFLIAGFVLLFDGVVQLCVRKKTSPWKEGGASLLAGAIIAGVRLFVALTGIGLDVSSSCLVIAGLVLALNGVVQLCVRKKTGPWKEGGASLLAGAIIAGVPSFLALTGILYVFASWLINGTLATGYVIWWSFIIAGLVLAFNGVVQLCVRKKTGPWKEGGASLLAGTIITVVPVPGVVLAVLTPTPPGLSLMCLGSATAGPVLALNGVVQLCVRKKTGLWKEGGASLLAGAIITVVHLVPFA